MFVKGQDKYTGIVTGCAPTIDTISTVPREESYE
jgi:hypothetical protein